MTRKRRTYNTRLIKKNLSYSVQDISERLGVHKNAVLRWIKDGLPLIDQNRPYLIHGADLAEYLRKKQAKRKHKCKPDEFFCFKCRLPRRAGGNIANIVIRNENKLVISGLCTVCKTLVRRAGAVKKLTEYQKTFSVQTMVQIRITDHNSASAMCDSKEETGT